MGFEKSRNQILTFLESLANCSPEQKPQSGTKTAKRNKKMKINIYSFEDNFLGTVVYLGQNQWGDDGFDSEDFDKITLDKIANFLQSKHNERLSELLIGKIDWFTVNLPESF